MSLTARPIAHPGDTPAMIASRERVFGEGLFDAVTAALAGAVPPDTAVVVDLGAGTGHHTAAVLEAAPDAAGVAVDSSKPALRRAARAHPRLAAVGADATRTLPLHAGVATLVMLSFAPRNVAEIARICAPGGRVLVAVPTPAHLAEIRAPLRMLEVPDGKVAEVRAALGTVGFGGLEVHEVRKTLRLDRRQAADLAAMGPAAFHSTPEELEAAAAALPARVETRLAVMIVAGRRSSR